eukprot:GHVO01017309.1.p1 GENE.GHVO01017309.1~~GHVO01017309.1.p1  ORF type:complete len:143 (+),score=25.50 GHVO01017309.1:158-586(+)
MVIDCTDTHESRCTINRVALLRDIPMISGGVVQWYGHVNAYNLRGPAGGRTCCYECLHPCPPPIVQTAATHGVVGMIPGFIGCIQALEALKILIGLTDGSPLYNRMMMYDGMAPLKPISIVNIRGPREKCHACGGGTQTDAE